VLLEVRGLTGPRLSDCTFELRAGEVLGLGGLHGQGQSDLLLTLFGARPASAGEVRHDGRAVKLSGPRAALRRGLAYVSGDRGRAGALAGRPIVENVSLAMLAKGAARLVSRAALQARVKPIMERLKVRFGGYSRPLSSLSGGNQQKVILGRALAAQPRIFLLDDPTKGIDVEAKRDLYELIAEIRREGAAVILYSSEDAELLENADRVLVFNGGRIVEEIGGDRLTEFNLYSAALKSAA
jgi:ribose transport system ATP-binding protein